MTDDARTSTLRPTARDRRAEARARREASRARREAERGVLTEPVLTGGPAVDPVRDAQLSVAARTFTLGAVGGGASGGLAGAVANLGTGYFGAGFWVGSLVGAVVGVLLAAVLTPAMQRIAQRAAGAVRLSTRVALAAAPVAAALTVWPVMAGGRWSAELAPAVVVSAVVAAIAGFVGVPWCARPFAASANVAGAGVPLPRDPSTD